MPHFGLGLGVGWCGQNNFWGTGRRGTGLLGAGAGVVYSCALWVLYGCFLGAFEV